MGGSLRTFFMAVGIAASLAGAVAVVVAIAINRPAPPLRADSQRPAIPKTKADIPARQWPFPADDGGDVQLRPVAEPSPIPAKAPVTVTPKVLPANISDMTHADVLAILRDKGVKFTAMNASGRQLRMLLFSGTHIQVDGSGLGFENPAVAGIALATTERDAREQSGVLEGSFVFGRFVVICNHPPFLQELRAALLGR